MLKLVPADLFEAVLIAPEDEVRQNARFIQESTRDGAAFLSGSEGGHEFGSVFRLLGTNGRNGGLPAKTRDISSD